jgi:hypothetical protein
LKYRVQLPQSEPAPGPELVVTAEVGERRRHAMNAIADLLRRLALLFPRGLEGLDEKHPAAWARIRLTEQRVDSIALAYIGGKLSMDALARALRAHEAAWQRGAQSLAGDRSGDRP